MFVCVYVCTTVGCRAGVNLGRERDGEDFWRV